MLTYTQEMTPRRLIQQPLYLEPEKFDLLKQLAEQTRIPRAVLMREAIDDLLVKHKLLRKPKRPL